MKINDLICVTGNGGYFNWDLAGMKAGGMSDGFAYVGTPVTPGFTRLVQPSEVISVMLVLEDGQVAFGDCMDVILSGAAGRDPLFKPDEHLPLLESVVRERLVGQSCTNFKTLAEEFDEMRDGDIRLHTAVRYGLTQALLHGVALSRRTTMAEVIADDYGCDIAKRRVPILSMCQTKDYELVDKMILKRADVLPHADFIRVQEDLGPDGHKMLAYAEWLVKRIGELGEADYRPTLHLDVYGTIGERFEMNMERIVDFIVTLESKTGGLALYLETPIIMPSQTAQVDAYATLRDALKARGSTVTLIVDEWCNTFEDVKLFADAQAADMIQVKAPDLGGLNNSIDSLLYCKRANIGAYMGGTANETDQSSRISSHVALACDADLLIAKPGQGVDEAMMIERNEMNRTLALIERR